MNATPILSVIVQATAAKKLREGYPWVFKNEVLWHSGLELSQAGEVAHFVDEKGKPLGVGYFNPHTNLVGRVLAHGGGKKIDTSFFAEQFSKALAKRSAVFHVPYYRLVHADADGFSGLIVDRFSDVCVVQVSTAGMEKLKPLWLPALQEVLGQVEAIERADLPLREREGLDAISRSSFTESRFVEVLEGSVKYLADLYRGQKTGWFYDQRANRQHVASLVAGKTMLDLYTHTGGFGIAAAVAGAASVTLVDSSEHALDIALRAAQLNPIASKLDSVCGDIFELLPTWVEEGRLYDVVVADPPAFIKDKQHTASGLKGYEKLARMCVQLVKPGGIMFIASCSHHASPPEFKKAVEIGMKKAERKFTLLRSAGADEDHPVHPQLPQSQYLKALTYQV